MTAKLQPDRGPQPHPAASELHRLLAQLHAGDVDALAAIYDRTARELYGLALWRCGAEDEAEDALQDVFVRLARKPPDPAKLRDPRAYLLTMARRSACDVLRRRRPAEPLEGLLLTAPEVSPELPVDAATATRHLARLSEVQREAVYLRYFTDLTFAEIGAVTEVPTFTAASRCRTAVERLRRLMGVER